MRTAWPEGRARVRPEDDRPDTPYIHPRSEHLMMSRRAFMATGALVPAALATPAQGAPPALATNTEPWPGFPAQRRETVFEMVAMSHGNTARVRELVRAHPALARAAWDWGFGDWETALGAACHMGNREIAEFLLERGAHPTIFSAAMLGQVAIVAAYLEATPGVEGVAGPHGITLMAHARAGGERARAVVELLRDRPLADRPSVAVPVAEADLEPLVGEYRFGPGTTDAFTVKLSGGQLVLQRPGTGPRPLTHLGRLEFHPPAAEAVRITFARDERQGWRLTIRDGDTQFSASRP